MAIRRNAAHLQALVHAAIAVAVCALLAPAAAQAAFPGTNGKLAFSSPRSGFPADSDLYTMSADGTSQTRITSLNHDELYPAWSPNGQKIAFQRDPGLHPDIWTANADGSNRVQLTNNNANDVHPAYSNNGAKIVFASDRAAAAGTLDLFVMNADGSGQVNITNTPSVNEDYPAWSPDGSKIAYARDGDINTISPAGTGRVALTQTPVTEVEPNWSPNGAQIVYRQGFDTADEIWKMNANGSSQVKLTTNGATVDERPSWSPAGNKIVFARGAFNNAELYVMNPDGSAQTRITNNTLMDSHPAWQPIPVVAPPKGYPRPKGADVVRTSIVPAFRPCYTSNRTHGPPLEHPSCHPPRLRSRYLTVGTPDANGAGARFIGRFVARVMVGNPATAADEADVALSLQMSDIRRTDNLADYTGQVRARFTNRRLTDNQTLAPGGGLEAGTARDGWMGFTVPCIATSDAKTGSTCVLTTTMEALAPGTVKEKARAIWELGQLQVLDGGPDGDVKTADNDLFAVQGIFIP